MFDYSFFELYYTRHDILMGMKSINRKTYSDAKKEKLYMTLHDILMGMNVCLYIHILLSLK